MLITRTKFRLTLLPFFGNRVELRSCFDIVAGVDRALGYLADTLTVAPTLITAAMEAVLARLSYIKLEQVRSTFVIIQRTKRTVNRRRSASWEL